jgi:hypothetical protein
VAAERRVVRAISSTLKLLRRRCEASFVHDRDEGLKILYPIHWGILPLNGRMCRMFNSSSQATSDPIWLG